jgi:hypothetical protein
LSNTTTIAQFFAGKTLIVPSYQRDYAWEISNANDLLNDIEEALSGHTAHYIGTFILSRNNGTTPLYVVDGQQRLTTLTMILHALMNALAPNDPIRQQYYGNFICDPNPHIGYKFQPAGDNKKFFQDLLSGQPCSANTAGQEQLQDVYNWIKGRVNNLLKQGGQQCIYQWLYCISNLQALEFIESDEGKAIRMFQSVNDRGVPLCTIDIVKSLLIYYSNRYLAGSLDQHVAQKFGDAFHSFARIKRLASEPGFTVKNISRKTFTEDDILRHHYWAFDDSTFVTNSGTDSTAEGPDFSATADRILNNYLKPLLTKLRTTPPQLEAFIREYTDGLVDFFGGLESLLKKSRTDKPTYLLLVAHDLSATLYPLLIQLNITQRLESTPLIADAKDHRTLLEFIELADMRVFKMRGTNPQADIAKITNKSNSSTALKIAQQLLIFCRKWMPDALMKSNLTVNDVFHHAALPPIFWALEADYRNKNGTPALSIQELSKLHYGGLSIEHIHSQTPTNSNITLDRFTDIIDYEEHNHRLGNLLLLESKINSYCKNSTIHQKITLPGCYNSSNIEHIKSFAISCYSRSPCFSKQDLNARTDDIAHFAVNRWKIY